MRIEMKNEGSGGGADTGGAAERDSAANGRSRRPMAAPGATARAAPKGWPGLGPHEELMGRSASHERNGMSSTVSIVPERTPVTSLPRLPLDR